MRTALFTMAFIALIALTGAPAFATDGGEQQQFKCSNCGETINIGSHTQSGQTVKCPNCGAEICEKKEEEAGLCFGADAGFFSKYVSRGVTWTDGPVFQPDLWASYKGFTLSVWGSMDLTGKNGLEGDISELDYTLDYSNNIGPLEYSAGAIYYTFPNTGDADTAEVYAGLSYDILLSPKLVVYYDFWQADGFYGVMSISHSFEMPELIKGIKSSVDLSAQAGLGSRNYNEFYSGDSHTAFTDYLLTVAVPVSLTDNISIKPTVSYSSVLDKTIRTKSSHNDNVIFGGVVSASF